MLCNQNDNFTKNLFDLLPFELVDMIAQYDIDVYKKLLIYRKFALKTLDPPYNKKFRILFTISEINGVFSVYKLNGKIHRDNDLPAIEYPDGSKVWYKYGKLHRENDLPAIEYASGTKKWFTNGVLNKIIPAIFSN